jgi:hypothetical protein
MKIKEILNGLKESTSERAPCRLAFTRNVSQVDRRRTGNDEQVISIASTYFRCVLGDSTEDPLLVPLAVAVPLPVPLPFRASHGRRMVGSETNMRSHSLASDG